MSKETGGAAFARAGFFTPEGPGDYDSEPEDGMTLRDYFAVRAMQSLVRRYDGHPFGGGPNSPQYKELSEDAYFIADAMLAERIKP